MSFRTIVNISNKDFQLAEKEFSEIKGICLTLQKADNIVPHDRITLISNSFILFDPIIVKLSDGSWTYTLENTQHSLESPLKAFIWFLTVEMQNISYQFNALKNLVAISNGKLDMVLISDSSTEEKAEKYQQFLTKYFA